jgi:hypothetical protein
VSTGTPDAEAAAGSFPLTGGCNCRAVRFEVTAPFESSSYCHCTRCQRRTGTAAAPNARTAPGTFRILQGEDRLRAWRPETGMHKYFCGECGSALFSAPGTDFDQVGVRLGVLDADPGIRPTYRQYVKYAAVWEPIPDDGLPRHPEARPR